MRLNRVLQLNRVPLLAASISLMVFALVFTISCSGDDGKPGKPGESCYPEAKGDGWDIFCGEDTDPVGHLQGPGNGPGDQGPGGRPGQNGANGAVCKIVGGTDIVCDGKNQGKLDACNVDTTSTLYATKLTCFKNNNKVEINFCSTNNNSGTTVIYDPDVSYCRADGTPDDAANNTGKCGSGTYLRNTQYCGLVSKTTGTGNNQKTVIDTVALSFCGSAKLGQKLMLNKKKETSAVVDGSDCESGYNGIWAKNTETSEACWVHDWIGKGDYCQILNAKGKARVARDDISQYVNQKTVPGYCNGVAYNKDTWKGEYCGYQQNSGAQKVYDPKSSPLCADFVILDNSEPNADGDFNSYGPHQIAYDLGYCQWGKDREGKYADTTQYSEFLCNEGVALDKRDGSRINKNRNAGQYCGFASTAAQSSGSDGSGAKTPLTGACDKAKDGTIGPNQNKYNGGYCTVLPDDRLTGKTTYTEDWCRADTNPNGVGANNKINSPKWNREYCGVNDKGVPTKYPDINAASPKDKFGICDDGQGPLEDWNLANYCQADKDGVTSLSSDTCSNGDRINVEKWAGEYCGFASEAAVEDKQTSALKGACGDGQGPNTTKFGGGFCIADKNGDLAYTNAFCGGKTYNENEWKGQYCGAENETSTLATKVYDGVCDDGYGPNEVGFFGIGYCRINSDADSTTERSSERCGENKEFTTNEGSWKGEYCFKGDNKVGFCTGGRVANLDKKSTDPITVRCDFPNGNICATDKLNLCDEAGCNALAQKVEAGDEFTYSWLANIKECRKVEVAAPQSSKKKKLASK